MRRGLEHTARPEAELAAVQVVEKMDHVPQAKVDVYRFDAV
mgnify:CR=1 FL=1